MPFYVADYLGDTNHLNRSEHGAYLLLILYYWQHRGLPMDDGQLARIARCTPEEWQDIRPTMAGFFKARWRHKRIDVEIKRAEEIIQKRSAAGRASAEQRSNKSSTHVQHMSIQLQLQSKKDSLTDRNEKSGVPPEAVASVIKRAGGKMKANGGSQYLWLKQTDTRVPKARAWWAVHYGSEMPLVTNDSGKQGYRVPWTAIR